MDLEIVWSVVIEDLPKLYDTILKMELANRKLGQFFLQFR
ncbi:MAG: hypothetical protein V2B20_00400 [Pseudomonadota bacterium]